MSIKTRVEKLELELQEETQAQIVVTIRVFDRLPDGNFYYVGKLNRETGKIEPIDPPIPVSRGELTGAKG